MLPSSFRKMCPYYHLTVAALSIRFIDTVTVHYSLDTRLVIQYVIKSFAVLFELTFC